MSSRKVSTVWLQTPIDIAGIPGATTQLSKLKTPKAVMELTELGLELTQGVVKAFIPIANIKAVVFSESEAKPK